MTSAQFVVWQVRTQSLS